ncbi:MAG: hypothetical protein M0Q38_02275 [Bacteroidales bacterium]|jgi:hypothetical protein|nr:hypothetical protein [Bacteroidales bacterium]
MLPSGPKNKSASVLVAILLLFSISSVSFAQCCSTGSPVGASVYVGVLGKNYLRVIAFYRYSNSDTYYQGNIKTDNNPLQSANYDFTGLAFGYGITNRLTAEVDFGYFINKTQIYLDNNIFNGLKTKGFGLSNGGVNLKYGIFVLPAKQIELTAGAGFRYPFTTNPQMVDGVQLNRDIQPSTNAFGANGMLFFNFGIPSITLRLFTINRYEYNFPDKINYKYGNILMNSIFISKKITKYFFGILQMRNEYKTTDIYKGDPEVNTGYDILFLSPQLSYSVAGKWNVTLLCDIPVYKTYKGRQLTPKYACALSLTRDINLGKKQPRIEPGMLTK